MVTLPGGMGGHWVRDWNQMDLSTYEGMGLNWIDAN